MTSAVQSLARIRLIFLSRVAVRCIKWGVRDVTIEILEWGSPQESLEILMSRRKSRPARKMVERLLIQDAT